MANKAPALSITGAPGAGATALAKEISEVLWRAREPHAIVDLDELCRGLLPGDTETCFHIRLGAENLAAVWSSFRCRGSRRLVGARIVESADDIAVVTAAVPDCELTIGPLELTVVHAAEQRGASIADLALEVIARLGWPDARAASDWQPAFRGAVDRDADRGPRAPPGCARSVALMRSDIRRVAVFCASTPGADPEFARRSYDVGRELAERGIGLVHGAGGHGLMRDVSQGALDGGGEVIGVIPRSMIEREWGRVDLTDVHVVDTMHERKARMAELADAFLGLPGGLGTLEEIIEVWSWRPIGFNDGPVGLLNIKGFWTPLLEALERLVDAGFVRREVMDDLVVAATLTDALEGLDQRMNVTFGDKLGRSRTTND